MSLPCYNSMESCGDARRLRDHQLNYVEKEPAADLKVSCSSFWSFFGGCFGTGRGLGIRQTCRQESIHCRGYNDTEIERRRIKKWIFVGSLCYIPAPELSCQSDSQREINEGRNRLVCSDLHANVTTRKHEKNSQMAAKVPTATINKSKSRYSHNADKIAAGTIQGDDRRWESLLLADSAESRAISMTTDVRKGSHAGRVKLRKQAQPPTSPATSRLVYIHPSAAQGIIAGRMAWMQRSPLSQSSRASRIAAQPPSLAPANTWLVPVSCSSSLA